MQTDTYLIITVLGLVRGTLRQIPRKAEASYVAGFPVPARASVSYGPLVLLGRLSSMSMGLDLTLAALNFSGG